MSLVAVIPSRGGSKGIIRKNIKEFLGRPLVEWSIEVGLACRYVDRVIVSTEDEEIARVAIKAGAEVPFLRPKELARDDTPGVDPVIDLLRRDCSIGDVVLLQPTSPLRSVKNIEEIIELRSMQDAESAVSVNLCEKHPDLMYTMKENSSLVSYTGRERKACRQEFSEVYTLNGALFLATRDFLLREQTFITRETIGYIMAIEDSIDIDCQYDWDIAEMLMRKKSVLE